VPEATITSVLDDAWLIAVTMSHGAALVQAEPDPVGEAYRWPAACAGDAGPAWTASTLITISGAAS
jgi:hypothetical protein